MFDRLQNSRNALGLIFMLPAALLLLLFLTYPLGLGVWLGFTDAKVGRPGEWIGFDNYVFIATDSVTQLALFNTLFYTTIASVLKFFLGVWLALLLNRNLRFKSFFRAVILLADVQEFAYKEIAEMLRIPIGTVMSRLNRGRKILREKLTATAYPQTMCAS